MLGTSIEERPDHVSTREEFGYWEIDTVIGTKDKGDSVLLTLVERQTRHFIVRKIASKTVAVQSEIADIKVYFTYPYTSYERGTNERHNGLLRRFLPKGNPINAYSIDDIAFVED